MILLGTKEDKIVGRGKVSNRLVGLADIMPTLLNFVKLKYLQAVMVKSMLDNKPRNFYMQKQMKVLMLREW